MSTPIAKHQGLYAFSLPPALLPSLQPRQLVIPQDHPLARPPPPPSPPPPSSTLPVEDKREGGAFTCALTGASFATLQELRDHYKTDWYRYNVKLRLKGEKTPVGEEEFKRRMEDLSDSLSGSDSDSSASSASSSSSPSLDGDDSDSQISRLLRKHGSVSNPSGLAQGLGGEEEDDPLALGGPRSALLWFDAAKEMSKGGAGVGEEDAGEGEEKRTQYGVYRAILPFIGSLKRSSPTEGSEALSELSTLQLPPSPTTAELEAGPDGGRKWTLLMFGGGHFAGMVVKLRPRLVGRGKGKEKDREVEVVVRKTFHRYTTRRKQGGGQSANDNANGKAKSMGAQLRRHNEAALTDEVRALLLSWKSLIDDSELVFLRCSKNNYKTFFGYDGDVLSGKKGEGRVRGFTFPTRRPTIAELLRSFLELTRVKTTHLTSSELAALDASYLSSITPKTLPPPVPTVTPPSSASEKKKPEEPRLTKEEELERDRWSRLLEMTRKGRLEALSSFLDKYGPELESGTSSSPSSSSDSDQPKEPWMTLPAFLFTLDPTLLRTPTILHVASASDQPLIVRFLLESKRADPTLHPSHLPSPSKNTGRTIAAPTPFELAPSRGTRNQFRFLAHPEHRAKETGERTSEWWDWTGTGVGGARVSSGLDEKVEMEREKKEQEKREKVRQREAERARLAQEEAEKLSREADERAARDLAARQLREPGKSGPQRLGGQGGGVVGAMRERGREGLSEEQKRRVEREERARAAEERFKRMQGGR
ncbi:hypothetical protein JCM8547_009197 [Rhodosporidiobolus lusitaniae]